MKRRIQEALHVAWIQKISDPILMDRVFFLFVGFVLIGSFGLFGSSDPGILWTLGRLFVQSNIAIASQHHERILSDTMMLVLMPIIGM